MPSEARLCSTSEARLCSPSEARLCLPSEARHHLSLPQELAGKPAGDIRMLIEYKSEVKLFCSLFHRFSEVLDNGSNFTRTREETFSS